MDIEYLKRTRKKLQSELIHEEIFHASENYKYYTLGVAQGLYYIYKVLNQVKDKHNNITPDEIMQVIKQCASDDERLNGYFFRLLKDLED